jgi:Putative Flp pilus-assembly TadE/G-like
VRVLLNRRRNERGVATILVALLAVSLLLMAGIVLDFGQAYMSKRNLQKAADAGALAAAQELTQFEGKCSDVLSNSTALGKAKAAATKYRDLNRESYLPPSSDIEYSVSCDPDLKVLVVRYGVTGTTQSFFGPLIGRGQTLSTDRRAEATIDVAPFAGEGVRPLAICSAQISVVPKPANYPFLRIDSPKNSVKLPATCPAITGGGNWWVLDCPDEPSGQSTEWQVRNGCENSVSIIPGQEDTLTPGELTVVLGGACAPKDDSDTCLSGDTGSIDSGQVATAWKELVQKETASIFPVFCAVPQCSASSIEGTGTGTVYPVYKMVSAIVCGYHFSKTEKFHSSSGQCAGLPSAMQAGDDPAGNEENYLIIKFLNVRTSGSNQESECALGADCDGGLRRTRLTG